MILKDSPKLLYDSLKPICLNDAKGDHCVSLSSVGKVLGEGVALSLVALIVTDVVKFFNVGKSMNAQQVIQTANLVIEDYYYLNIEDFKLCFNKAKKGVYGKVYDRIDGQVLIQWLEMYSIERSNHYEFENNVKDENFKSPRR